MQKIKNRKDVAMSKTKKSKQPSMAAAVTKPPVPQTHEKESPPPATNVMIKRIGGTTYHVAVHFSKTSNETMNDKISRLIRNETFSGKAAGQ